MEVVAVGFGSIPGLVLSLEQADAGYDIISYYIVLYYIIRMYYIYIYIYYVFMCIVICMFIVMFIYIKREREI